MSGLFHSVQPPPAVTKSHATGSGDRGPGPSKSTTYASSAARKPGSPSWISRQLANATQAPATHRRPAPHAPPSGMSAPVSTHWPVAQSSSRLRHASASNGFQHRVDGVHVWHSPCAQ